MPLSGFLLDSTSLGWSGGRKRPLFISSNARPVYDDLIGRGKKVETAKLWRVLIPCSRQIPVLCVSSI